MFIDQIVCLLDQIVCLLDQIVCLLDQIVIESLQIGADKDVIVKSAFMLSFKASLCDIFLWEAIARGTSSVKTKIGKKNLQ